MEKVARETLMAAKNNLPESIKKHFNAGFVLYYPERRMTSHDGTLSIIVTSDGSTAFLLKSEQFEKLRGCLG